MRPFDYIGRLADQRRLDRLAMPLRDYAKKLLRPRGLTDVLHGVWLGHPLHPALVQLPTGAFFSSAVADALPGQQRSAETLLRTGLIAAVPAAVAGLADYMEGHEEQQRVGVVHAAGNTLALVCYFGSLRLRAAQRRAPALAASSTGHLMLAVSAALGGHMSYHLAMGANHAQGVPHLGPTEWTDVGAFDGLTDGEPVKRFAGDTAVVLVRDGTRVDALSDVCAHASAPLHQGTVLDGASGDPDAAGERCLRCPWHGSVYRLRDGQVVHGPATAEQPPFDSRVVAGRVQVKVRTYPGVPSAG